ncbi:hypothetical protein [Streptomyces rimosus]|uniref:hypothetical protein n=1 Tax=Streptomyces rimosus TaxID=1927 RepID=UPI000ABA5594|nr:hypothetical protein [Streptomyces rimosus]
MPGWIDLAYTTAGGIIGAAVTNHLSRNQERRQLRAAVMQQLLRVTAVRDTLCGIAPAQAGSGPRHLGETSPPATARFGVMGVTRDGHDVAPAQQEAIAGLVVAALSAGVPRRLLDFAGGGEERALQCDIIALLDHRLGGVLGDSLGELMRQSEEYRQATAQHLLRALWHPWQARLRMRALLRTMRRDVEALHRRQEAAMSVLARPEHRDALAERLGEASGPREVSI